MSVILSKNSQGDVKEAYLIKDQLTLNYNTNYAVCYSANISLTTVEVKKMLDLLVSNEDYKKYMKNITY